MSKKYPAKIGMCSRYGPCPLERIRTFEKETGMSLPDDYRDFLREWNGCTFEPYAAFALTKPSGIMNSALLESMGGLPEKPDPYSLYYANVGYGFGERVPKRFLAIGDTAFLRRVCISRAGEDRGYVYFWDPVSFGSEEGEELPTSDDLTLVAKSFREFFDSLWAETDDEFWAREDPEYYRTLQTLEVGEVQHYLCFPSEQTSQNAANLLRARGFDVENGEQTSQNVANMLRELGFDVENPLGADGVNWLVLVKNPTGSAEMQELFEDIAAQNAGEYYGSYTEVEGDESGQ